MTGRIDELSGVFVGLWEMPAGLIVVEECVDSIIGRYVIFVEGSIVGDKVGLGCVGASVITEDTDGDKDGARIGCIGCAVGIIEPIVGCVGEAVGIVEPVEDGAALVGDIEGDTLGSIVVGVYVGLFDGDIVGVADAPDVEFDALGLIDGVCVNEGSDVGMYDGDSVELLDGSLVDTIGVCDGETLGTRVEYFVGDSDGDSDGASDGLLLGVVDGDDDGLLLGVTDGNDDGEKLGSDVGDLDGDSDGDCDGLLLGDIERDNDGFDVDMVGLFVGAGVGDEVGAGLKFWLSRP